MRIITNSEISSLWKCPKNHEFGYVRGLTPKRRRISLDEGTAGHTALETFYKGGTLEASIDAYDKIYDDHVAALESYPDEREKAITKFLGTRALVQAYLDTVALKDKDQYDTTLVEQEFNVPILDPDNKPLPDVTFAGKVDGIFIEKKTGIKFLLENKLYSSFDDVNNNLYLDQQMTVYSLAVALAFGVDCRVSLYNVLRKPRNERKKGESPELFYDRIYMAVIDKPSEYFHRVPITRGPDHFRVARELLYNAAMIITGKTPLPYVYRNTGDHCLWLCSFKPICISENQRMVEELYKKKEKLHPELEIKE